MQSGQFAILYPLIIGTGVVGCTIFIHALTPAASISLFRHERKLGHTGSGALTDLSIVALVLTFAFVAHLLEIALWAALLVFCGEFSRNWSRLLPLGRQLHDTGLWGFASYPDMATAGSGRGD
jgi:hypothetical protein